MDFILAPAEIGRELARIARHPYLNGAEPAAETATLGEPAPSLPDAERLQREADRLLLARYSPAGVLVDEALNILQFRGKTGPYLEPPSGPATLNLQKFARPGLLVALGAALGQVKQDGTPVRKAGLPLEIEGRRREITLEVIPVKVAPGENRYYLILFEEAVPALPPAGRPRPLAALWAELTRAARGGDRPVHTDQEAREVLQLKRELEATRDYIQRMMEEHEAANEELKSAQEELLSSNEEFQSTNEELETAKEELQSVNEELITTSEELRHRNRELFEVNDALTQARDYAEAIVETVREPLLVLDGNLRVLRANCSFYQLFQTTPEKTEGAFIYRLGNREWDLPALRQMLEEILPKDLAFQDYEVTQVFPAIGEKTMRLNARRLEWKGRTPALILLAIEDITAHKHTAEALQQARDELEMRVQERTAVLKAEILERARAEEALFAEKEQLRITLAAIGDGVITTGPQGRVESLNRVAEQLTGQTEAQAQGRPLAEVFKIVNDDTREPADDPMQRCLREGEIIGLADHSLLLRPDGTEIAIEDSAAPILNRAGRMAGVVLIFRDVTEKRRNARELHYQASHDALTGLINRHEFERRLQRVLKTSNGEHALLYLDLDQFKIVNDTCGHTAGDELLHQLATLMATQVRKRDTLARLGGDEFGVLLEHCSVEQALRLAQTLQQTVQDFRFTCDNKHFTAGVSIGLVPIPQGGDTLAQVLSAADSACYAAKDKGRNRIHVYAASDEELTQRHGQMQWIPRLHQALADGHLRLYFQPIVPVTGEVAGGVHGELLLRLVGEDGQIVSPGSFLPAAERYHQVQPLDRWVIRAALAAMCALKRPHRS